MKKISSLFLALILALLFCTSALGANIPIRGIGEITRISVRFTDGTSEQLVPLPMSYTVPSGKQIDLVNFGFTVSSVGSVFTLANGIITLNPSTLNWGSNLWPGQFNIFFATPDGSDPWLLRVSVTDNSFSIDIAPPLPSGSGSEDSSSSPPSIAHEQAIIGNCKEWVNVRSGPGIEYDIIGKAYLGEEIELLQWNNGETWCRIYYNNGNNIGWVQGNFIIPLK